MIVLLCAESLPARGALRRGLLRRGFARRAGRRADNPETVMHSTAAGAYAVVTMRYFADMSEKERAFAERALADGLCALSARRVILRRGGPHAARLEEILREVGVAVEDGLQIKRALGCEAVGYIAQAAGIPPASLRIGVLDPDLRFAHTVMRRLFMLARSVTLVTGDARGIDELRERLLDEMGAAFTVSDELAALRRAHIIVCYGGLEQLLADRSQSQNSVVLNLQQDYGYAMRPRQIVCDALHLDYDAARYGPLPEWAPRQEFFSMAMSEWIGFKPTDVSISGFSGAGEIVSVLNISMRLNTLDS